MRRGCLSVAGLLAAACAAGVALVSAPGASADTAPLPNDGDLPWTNPAHTSPLEILAGQIASRVAGRAATVQCDGQNDWNNLAGQWGFDPTVELGFVPFYYWIASRTVGEGGDTAFLSPTVCWNLEQFGIANPKPTKCQPVVSNQTTQAVTQRYRVTVRVKAHGKVHTERVWRMRVVQQTVTTQTLGPFAPCYLGNERSAANEPPSYWQTYSADALAILTLAHESIHIAQDQIGASIDVILPTSETDANCYGLQWMPYVAEQLGATPDDAESIAEYAYDYLYPGYQGDSFNGSPYWSSDCRQDGPLDLTPGDGVWP